MVSPMGNVIIQIYHAQMPIKRRPMPGKEPKNMMVKEKFHRASAMANLRYPYQRRGRPKISIDNAADSGNVSSSRITRRNRRNGHAR